MHAYHVVYTLSALIGAVAVPLICALNWLALAQARQRRLTAYIRWLMPVTIGATLMVADELVSLAGRFLWVRLPAMYGVASILHVVGAVLTVVGAALLWRMLRDLPVSAVETMPQPPPGIDDRTWPPPPRTGAS